MAIAFTYRRVAVGSNGTSSSLSATNTAGRFLICCSLNSTSDTVAPVPTAGWVTLVTEGNFTIAYQDLTGAPGISSTGAWTNANNYVVVAYSGVVGIGSVSGGHSTSDLLYPALTLTNSNNTSWVFRTAGSRTETTLTTQTVPGYVARSTSTGTAGRVSALDTDGSISTNPTSYPVVVSSGSAYSIELLGESGGGPDPSGLVKVKRGGTFSDAALKIKSGGVFSDVALKVKSSGTWTET